jgi:hypothetical protein
MRLLFQLILVQITIACDDRDDQPEFRVFQTFSPELRPGRYRKFSP